MSTKLYFNPLATTVSGTLPSGEQSAQTPSWTATNGATNFSFQLTPYGVADIYNSGNSLASTSAQNALMGMFVSPPLRTTQAVGGGNLNFMGAELEGNGAANFWANGLEIYVWRPSTGTKVGTVKAYGAASLGGTEPTISNTMMTTYISGITTTAVNPQIGDVIVCEVWARHTQGNATSRGCRFGFGGSTETTTENTSTTSPASYIEFAENLVFGSLLPVHHNYAQNQLLVR